MLYISRIVVSAEDDDRRIGRRQTTTDDDRRLGTAESVGGEQTHMQEICHSQSMGNRSWQD
jgi:hypothetical protein